MPEGQLAARLKTYPIKNCKTREYDYLTVKTIAQILNWTDRQSEDTSQLDDLSLPRVNSTVHYVRQLGRQIEQQCRQFTVQRVYEMHTGIHVLSRSRKRAHKHDTKS